MGRNTRAPSENIYKKVDRPPSSVGDRSSVDREISLTHLQMVLQL